MRLAGRAMGRKRARGKLRGVRTRPSCKHEEDQTCHESCRVERGEEEGAGWKRRRRRRKGDERARESWGASRVAVEDVWGSLEVARRSQEVRVSIVRTISTSNNASTPTSHSTPARVLQTPPRRAGSHGRPCREECAASVARKATRPLQPPTCQVPPNSLPGRRQQQVRTHLLRPLDALTNPLAQQDDTRLLLPFFPRPPPFFRRLDCRSLSFCPRSHDQARSEGGFRQLGLRAAASGRWVSRVRRFERVCAFPVLSSPQPLTSLLCRSLPPSTGSASEPSSASEPTASSFLTPTSSFSSVCVAHIIQSYTAILILALFDDDFSRLKRTGLLDFIGACQNPDGSFVSLLSYLVFSSRRTNLLLCSFSHFPGCGEDPDPRSTYSAFAIASMLNDWSTVDVDLALDFLNSCRVRPSRVLPSPSLVCSDSPSFDFAAIRRRFCSTTRRRSKRYLPPPSAPIS